MALELRQQLKLTQQLVMTPQLQQAIKLLQLSRLELVETVQQELLENPFLEETQEEAPTEAEERRVSSQDAEAQVYDKAVAHEADWEEYMGEFASTPQHSQARDFEIPEDMGFESRYAAKPSLEGQLMWQLRLSPMTEAQKGIGELIIGNLGSSGYLQASLEELASLSGATPEDVEYVLHQVQRFDPVGVAARTPQECLLVQIDVLNYSRDAILVDIVQNHLEDLENHRYKPLFRKFGLDMDGLREYIEIIQSLDPMPGASYGEGEPTYVSPDVYVYKLDDEFVIILNEDGLPTLQMSSFCTQVMDTATEKEKEYCSEKLRSASWLIKSLYQRQRTLYKVMESIVKYQRGFFENGVEQLHPLILKDIADDINMHESTVSRITTNKYVATPHGVYELKFFFNSALDLDDGTQVSSESVKALIKKFISEEDDKHPLSDERIGELLKAQLKVTIARRTVAKYRTVMDIPSSSRRKARF